MLWASYWIVNNKLKDKIDSSVTLFMSFLFGTVYLLAGTFGTDVHLSTLPGVLAGVYVGCFEMGISFLCFGLAIRKTSNPALINQLCYLAPFLSLFFIAIILNEQIVATTYAGLVLIVSGIVFNQYFVSSRKDFRREA